MKKIKLKMDEGPKMKGRYTITKSGIITPVQQRLHDKIVFLKNKGEDYIKLVRELNKICDNQVWVFDNITTTVGHTMFMNNFTSTSPTNVMVVNYIALGTGDTAVAIEDTTLDTETYRNAVASSTNATNTGYVTGFFSATETTGTFKEAGIFSNGTGAADSGVMSSRVLLNPSTGIVKTNVETLTVDWAIVLTDA